MVSHATTKAAACGVSEVSVIATVCCCKKTFEYLFLILFRVLQLAKLM